MMRFLVVCSLEYDGTATSIDFEEKDFPPVAILFCRGDLLEEALKEGAVAIRTRAWLSVTEVIGLNRARAV